MARATPAQTAKTLMSLNPGPAGLFLAPAGSGWSEGRPRWSAVQGWLPTERLDSDCFLPCSRDSRSRAVTDDTDDATLACRAAAGCVESFAALARRHQVPVVHYVRRLAAHSGIDADDVAQDAFLQAWRRIGDYDHRWAFSTWLFTIARRTWLNAVRACRRRRVREAAVATAGVGGEEPSAGVIAGERATRLWDVARAELKEREFTAVWLRYVEEKTMTEIAAVLDRPVATVKVMLFRARRRLEPLVQDLIGWGE